MTPEDLKYEQLLHALSEKPEIRLEDLIKTDEADEEWMKQQDEDVIQESLKELFNKAKIPPKVIADETKPKTRSKATAKIVMPKEKDSETI
jgi:hypothetical protein